VVAVKTLKDNASDKERDDLKQELHVMKMLEPHANVVRLLGCCTEKGEFQPSRILFYFLLPGDRNGKSCLCLKSLNDPKLFY
jgi:Protein tyrosine and serine/threonine kinase